MLEEITTSGKICETEMLENTNELELSQGVATCELSGRYNTHWKRKARHPQALIHDEMYM